VLFNLINAKGRRLEAFLLGIRDDGNLRVMAKGGRDCMELTPDGDRWLSEDGGYFEIESVTGEGWPELAEFLANSRPRVMKAAC